MWDFNSPKVMENPLPLWADPYRAGGTPMAYDSADYRISQALSSLRIYGTLYRLGAEQVKMDDYSNNSQWNGIVQYPGTGDYGGYSSFSRDTLNFVSSNIHRLYR